MNSFTKISLVSTLALSAPLIAAAQDMTSEFSVDFQVGSSVIEPFVGSNARSIARLTDLLNAVKDNPSLHIKDISVYGTASPEGNPDFNRRLSDSRRQAIIDLLEDQYGIEDSIITRCDAMVDWNLLVKMMAVVDEPWATEVADAVKANSDEESRLAAIKRLDRGRTWKRLMKTYFPQMRSASAIVVTLEKAPEITTEQAAEEKVYIDNGPAVFIEEPQKPLVEETGEEDGRKFYMDIRSNMLYDAALVPNIGVEFYLGRNFSLGANWQYAWWSKNSRHRYWRMYGGDINARWWFGSQAESKPLSGHHLGIYGQVATYDVEFGNRGWMGGTPGENIFHRANWGAGVEYGYSLPVARRINIDFTLGVGYFGGKVLDYNVIDGHYVWQGTKHFNWFGPTKAEISFVWLIGNGNVNVKKEKGNIDE